LQSVAREWRHAALAGFAFAFGKAAGFFAHFSSVCGLVLLSGNPKLLAANDRAEKTFHLVRRRMLDVHFPNANADVAGLVRCGAVGAGVGSRMPQARAGAYARRLDGGDSLRVCGWLRAARRAGVAVHWAANAAARADDVGALGAGDYLDCGGHLRVREPQSAPYQQGFWLQRCVRYFAPTPAGRGNHHKTSGKMTEIRACQVSCGCYIPRPDL